MNKKNFKAALVILVIGISVLVIANMDVSIRQGVDGKIGYIHMPLYAKWTQFLARHYEYARISSDITRGCKTEEEKVLAILNWTRQNIADVPAGFPLVDDHILTIITKGYGNPEQHQDVFTALCSYSGIPAFWRTVYGGADRSKYYLSFARINGKWCVFDAYYGVYFRNRSGGIASVEDVISGRPQIIISNIGPIENDGLPYMDFYTNLTPVSKPMFTRSEKQMPVKRIMYEGAKGLKLIKEDVDL
ncbi:MAG: transglutaminase-like domain-containing protein [Candidatus Omnitrophota bacterium]|jgi:hypothetical protein